MEEVEARPLIGDKTELDDDSSVDVYHLQRRSKRRSWIKLVATHVLVAVSTFLVTIIFNARMNIVFSNSRKDETQPSIYSPMTAATEYVIDHPRKDEWETSEFFGPPSEESEKAWDSFIFPRGQALQIFPDEAQHLSGIDTVKLKNGNPLLNLNVVHNLHCMRRIHKHLHRHYFYPNASEEWLTEDIHHTRHCLEAIRKSLVCKADFTLNRYYWSGSKLHDLKLTPEPSLERQCVNWDRVMEFLGERRYEPDNMMHGDVTLREYEGRTGPEEIGCEWNNSC